MENTGTKVENKTYKNIAELNTGCVRFSLKIRNKLNKKGNKLEYLSTAREQGLVNMLAEVTLGKLVATGGN